jgi:hypothetical protein
METRRDDIEKLLDLENSYIRNLYNTWDKGDCSTIGLARMLLIQEIHKEIEIRGNQYDGQYDDFLESILTEYKA